MEELHINNINKDYEANYRLNHVSGKGRILIFFLIFSLISADLLN
jgi:hypothetical protein